MPNDSQLLAEFSSVIITGGSSGIGKSFIELGSKMCPEILFCNLSRRAPDINSAELKLRHFPTDLAHSASIPALIKDIVSYLDREVPVGRILLINNSGFGTYGVFPEPHVAENLEMLDVNVRALVQITGLLLPFLRSRGGAVMTIASTAAFQPTPYMATYGASKAFVLHWTMALNEEWRGSNLRAIAVCPGPTATQFFRRAGLKEGSVADSMSMTTDDVVGQALRALHGRKSMVVTGWKNKLAAFFASKLPKAFVARISAKILARFRLRQVER